MCLIFLDSLPFVVNSKRILSQQCITQPRQLIARRARVWVSIRHQHSPLSIILLRSLHYWTACMACSDSKLSNNLCVYMKSRLFADMCSCYVIVYNTLFVCLLFFFYHLHHNALSYIIDEYNVIDTYVCVSISVFLTI
jgi:hypothetical protein